MKFYSVKTQFLILLLLTLSLSACNRRTQELIDDQQEKANATPLPPDDFPPDEEARQEAPTVIPDEAAPAAISCQISLARNATPNSRNFESCIGSTATEPKFSSIDSFDFDEQTQARIEMNYAYDSLTYTYATYKVQFYRKSSGRLSPMGLFQRYEVNLLDQNSMSLFGTIPNSHQEYILNCKVRSSCSK